MLIRDALYGAFEIPSYLDKLVLAPEFRRLSEVRLININSVSLASLADVRRYSHTLGVLRLALLNPLIGLGEPEYRAFLASIIVHDAGTPAFAHLFEYFLAERYDWSHEAVISDLLTGRQHPDNYALQIFQSQTRQFQRICDQEGIEFRLVLDFVERRHRFARLIFGSLDLDNLDNVARMNWMVGERVDLSPILNLARTVSVTTQGELELPRAREEDVRYWLRLRSDAYKVLVFDPPTVAGQAVLSKAIALALEQRLLDLVDWHYDDRELISALMRSSPNIKKRLQRDFINSPPPLCLLHVARDDLSRFDAIGRARLIALIETFLEERLGGVERVYGYAFRDRGTFSKQLDFVDPETRKPWSLGWYSDSLIFYGFRKGRLPAGWKAEGAGTEFREWIEARV
jgi:HD superfamily phosphohydrolase